MEKENQTNFNFPKKERATIFVPYFPGKTFISDTTKKPFIVL